MAGTGRSGRSTDSETSDISDIASSVEETSDHLEATPGPEGHSAAAPARFDRHPSGIIGTRAE